MSLYPIRTNNTSDSEMVLFIFEAEREFFSYVLVLIHCILKRADIMISKTQEPFEN